TIHDYEYHEALSALAADEKFKGLLYAAPDQGLSTEQMAVQNEAAENLVWDLLGRALKNGIHHTWRARGQGDHNAKTASRHLEEIFTNPAHPLFPPTLSYRDRVQRLLDFLPRKQMPWMPWDILAKVDRDALQAADIDRVMSFEDFYKFAKEINNWKNLPDPAAIAAALETLSFIYGAYPDAAEMNQLITEITPSSMQEKAKQGVRRKGPRTIDDAILKFKQQLQTTSYNTDVDDAITVMNKILRKAILTNDEVLMENVSRQLLRIIGQSYSYRAQPTYFSDKMNDLIRENAIATIQPLALQIGRIFSLFPPRMRGTPEFGQAFTQVLRMRTSVAQRLVIFQEIKKLFPSLLYQDPGSKDKDLFSSVDIPGHPQVTDDILRKILQDVENTSPSILWPNLDTPNSADRAAYLEYFTAAIKLAQDSPAHYRQKILSILGKNVLKDPLPLLAKIDFVYLLGGDPLLRTADGGQKVESVLDFLVDVAHSSPLAFNTYHKLFISPLESMARTGRAPDRLLTFYDRWHLAQLGIGYKDFEKAYPSIGPKLSPRSPSSPQKTSLGGGRPAQAASVTSAPSTLVGQDCAKNFL
ncbi:MAG: hypothetical protein J6Y94_05510, partial [Bacteriovoracaceae bacterium]|nr:hypothetical protein [Bacteriovoracaceae bacterium]